MIFKIIIILGWSTPFAFPAGSNNDLIVTELKIKLSEREISKGHIDDLLSISKLPE